MQINLYMLITNKINVHYYYYIIKKVKLLGYVPCGIIYQYTHTHIYTYILVFVNNLSYLNFISVYLK